ncbi:MAG: cyclic nucleotide-binding domain-containing protein [Nitrospirota bacterium]
MSKFWDNIFRGQKQVDRIDSILSRIPIFQGISTREMKTLTRIMHQREYRAHETIFHQDDVGLGMYIIIEGNVGIICEPEQHSLAELGEGDFFGELALLDDAPRSATARAMTPCRILCFFKPELLSLIERNPRLGSKILFRLAWTIGERLKKTNEQVRDLKCMTQLNVNQ